jgi:hypothetical protein
VPGALSPKVKRPEREDDHSPPCSAEVKNAWSFTSTSLYNFIALCLVMHRIYHHGMVKRSNFTFTFTYKATTFEDIN